VKTIAEDFGVLSIRRALCALGLEDQSIEWKLDWLLRVGVFMEFVGHGACGVHTKAGWLPYFHVIGIPDPLAWKLMPVIGGVDIALGMTALFSPRRALLLYMAVWGCFTAVLRPAAGESGWEFVERAYNFGVPLSLLLLYGLRRDLKAWFSPLKTVPALSEERARTLFLTLRVVVVSMLIGHGAFGFFVGKANLLIFYRAAGLGATGLPLAGIRAGVGLFEIGLGILALLTARPALFAFICAWKLASESLYLVSGAPLGCWEVVERGGSYVAPLAVLCVLTLRRASLQSDGRPRIDSLPDSL